MSDDFLDLELDPQADRDHAGEQDGEAERQELARQVDPLESWQFHNPFAQTHSIHCMDKDLVTMVAVSSDHGLMELSTGAPTPLIGRFVRLRC